MKRILLGMVFAFATIATTAAGPYEDAIQALDQGDLDTSLKLLRQAGEAGNVTAQSLLGGMFRSGYLQIRRNPAESVKWYRMAADRSDRDAQFRLSQSYETGTGVAVDLVKAHMWIDLSAESGHAQARQNRARIAALLTSTQLAVAKRMAREWKPVDP